VFNVLMLFINYRQKTSYCDGTLELHIRITHENYEPKTVVSSQSMEADRPAPVAVGMAAVLDSLVEVVASVGNMEVQVVAHLEMQSTIIMSGIYIIYL